MRNIEIITFLKSIVLLVVALPLAGQMEIESSGDAIKIIDAVSGINITSVNGTGLFVNSAGLDGVFVVSSDRYGVRISSAGFDGVRINSAGGDGISVGSAGGDGVQVDNADGHSMNIQGNKSDITLAGHIGLIYNFNTGNNADVLALKVGTPGNPGPGNNFITFYNGADASLGAVQGNSSGSVCYTTGGCDYAEYLPVIDLAQTFSPGDVVGVYSGYISKQTTNAQRVMVITDQAAMIGNKPGTNKDEAKVEGYETVSFIGQVLTKVKGSVHAGDWIVASGHEDGMGVAVAAEDIGLHHQIVGRAWESSPNPGIKRINTAVGLDQSDVWTTVFKALQAKNGSLQSQIDALYHLIMEMKEENRNDDLTESKAKSK